MIKQLLIIGSLFSIVMKAKGQEGTPGQIKSSFVQVRDVNTKNKKPVKRPCLLWLPSSYSGNSNSPFYPLLIFVHGSKEAGPVNGSSINALKKYGPFYFLQNKKWIGNAGYGGSCGQTDFIVFSMQSNTASGVDAAEIDYAIGQLLLRFRIDETRILFTGISEGSGSIARYIMDSGRIYKPRLIIPMSFPFSTNSSLLTTIAKRGVKLWAFTFDKDINAGINFKSATSNLVDNFNKVVSNSAKLTTQPGTHCCWNKYYDPAFREPDNDGTGQLLNIYEWMMKNISWGNGSPPINACEEYVMTPNKFAGYITEAKQIKKEVTGASCTIPVYSINGKIIPGSILYQQKSGENITGNKKYYGYSTSKLKAATADRYLIINHEGKVTAFEK